MSTTQTLDGISLHIDGDGAETVLMIHGWPDTHRLWDATVQALGPHCRCVRFTLPGFDITQPRRPTAVADLVEFFRRVVQQVSPGQPVTLLVHDWGAVFGYQFAMRHPELIRRVVGVDIGDAGSAAHQSSLAWKAKLGVVGYQWWLMLAWRIGALSPGLGDRMTRGMARALRCPAEQHLIGASMNYPYDMAWAGSFGGMRQFKPVAIACPMLFVYGLRKPFMFHSPAWADALAARPGCRVVGLPTGHWVMSNRPAEFHQAVLDWLLPALATTPSAP